MEKHPSPRMGTEGNVVGQRLLAFVLDSIIGGVLSLVIFIPALLLDELFMILSMIVALVIGIVYGFLLEGLYGYTPGKYIVGLVVVKSDGSPCTVGASVLRNLLLIVDQLPFAYLIGLGLILLTDRKQRVGDLVADTVVVSRR